MIGLFFGVLGAALLISSRVPLRARALVWTVIAAEAVWGIGIDLYKLAHGYESTAPLVWIVIHALIIATGILFLRATVPAKETPV